MSALSTPEPGSAGLAGVVRRWPLVSLSLCMLVLATPLMLWQQLNETHVVLTPIPLPLVLAVGLVPGLVAVLLTGIVDGRAGIKRLLGRFLIADLPLPWYLLALFGGLAYLLAGALIYALLGGRVSDMAFFSLAPSRWLPSVVLLLVVGMVFNTEEIAWRGFALPRLQPRYGALMATLLISVPEFLIHFAYFLNPATTQSRVGPFWFYIVTLTEAILFAAVFNNTRGSLLIVTMIHASQNAWEPLFENPSPWPFVIMTILIAVTSAVVVARLGPARLARGSAQVDGQVTADVRV